MPESEDTTMWQRVKPRRRYEGEDRRGPEPINWIPVIALGVTLLTLAISGLTGYVKTQAETETLRRDMGRMEAKHKEDMASYLGWNKSISERVRELERGR